MIDASSKIGALFFPVMQKVYWSVIKPTLDSKKLSPDIIKLYLAKNGLNISHKDRLQKVFDFQTCDLDTMQFFVMMLAMLDISLEYAISLVYADIEKITIFAKT